MSIVSAFLMAKGMHPELTDMAHAEGILRQQMALHDGPRTLHMIDSRLRLPKKLPQSGTAIALDAGGTHFRSALVEFKDGCAELKESYDHPMPGTGGEIGKEEFLSLCASYVEPLLKYTDRIGYVFSYPADVTQEGDGVLRHFQKEVRVRDCEGMRVCAELDEVLRKRGAAGQRRWVLLNDTVAALIGAYVNEPGPFDGAVGIVYGTGTNTCYAGEGTIINMESSSYSLFPRGKYDIELDAASTTPGDNIYEKMVASSYVGELIRRAVIDGEKEGVYSENLAVLARNGEYFTSPAFDSFMKGERCALSEALKESDRAPLQETISLIFSRAAKLGAIVLSAAMRTALDGKSEGKLLIAAEGTAYWKSTLYAPLLEQYLKDYVNSASSMEYRITGAENANFLGAASAAAKV